ncbi:hypothetical protein EWW49_30480, partial [Pseudomonas syringae]
MKHDKMAQVKSNESNTLLHTGPSMLGVFLEHQSNRDLPKRRSVRCSGEALPRALQDRYGQQRKGVELHDLYGPTEAAIDVTAWKCRPTDPGVSVRIGRQVANIPMHVLEASGHLQPLGVDGERHRGPIGIRNEQLNQPDLNPMRIVAHPFYCGPQP